MLLGPLHKLLSSPARALGWVRDHESPTGGILVHSGHHNAYPEVSGYLIPTLLHYGERELASRLARWLVCIQRRDGAYDDPDYGEPRVFDTGQVLRGLLAAGDLVPGAVEAARRAADYILSQMVEGGKGGFIPCYSGLIPESVHLYVLPPLIQAAEIFQKSEYRTAAERCLEYYCAHKDALQLITLTHFLGYELEALIDLGHSDLAIPILNKLSEYQADDGSIPAKRKVKWVCAPGLAQLAVCWYKVGQWEPADRAIGWLEAHQQPSGGFLGSYGRGASYFPDVELPWTVKFYLDAHLLRVTSFFDRNAHIFPDFVSRDDGRVQAILSVVRPNDRVLEVGCGKGRFLKAITEVYPDAQCTGVDISSALLACLPSNIRAVKGSLESIPYPDNHFDVVLSVEAIEHSPNPEVAVKEMVRVTRVGGWVVIIDKQLSHWGRLSCPSWERWPEPEKFRRWLSKWCDQVIVEPVGYDGKPPDGLMVVWRGRKRSRMSSSDWTKTMNLATSHKAIVERVKRHRLSEWAQVILLETSPGQKVLEIGAGTGEVSLHLARGGREVVALDVSGESLRFIHQCAAELGVEVRIVKADATHPLPFPDGAFDCVWSSGLLEHFGAEERGAILREQARVSKGKVIAMVPNAACMAYRAGKQCQEEKGTWVYGLEIPLLSLRGEFEAAGLVVLSEYSVGATHALNFLPKEHPLSKGLNSWMNSLSPEELLSCHQGYLLVTIGVKPR